MRAEAVLCMVAVALLSPLAVGPAAAGPARLVLPQSSLIQHPSRAVNPLLRTNPHHTSPASLTSALWGPLRR